MENTNTALANNPSGCRLGTKVDIEMGTLTNLARRLLVLDYADRSRPADVVGRVLNPL